MVRGPLITINLAPIRKKILLAKKEGRFISAKARSIVGLTREPIRRIRSESKVFMKTRERVPEITKRFKRSLRTGPPEGFF